jgi:hypothetical protein
MPRQRLLRRAPPRDALPRNSHVHIVETAERIGRIRDGQQAIALPAAGLKRHLPERRRPPPRCTRWREPARVLCDPLALSLRHDGRRFLTTVGTKSPEVGCAARIGPGARDGFDDALALLRTPETRLRSMGGALFASVDGGARIGRRRRLREGRGCRQPRQRQKKKGDRGAAGRVTQRSTRVERRKTARFTHRKYRYHKRCAPDDGLLAELINDTPQSRPNTRRSR